MEKVVVDVPKFVNHTRYNGGWLKSVTGLDKTRDDGFSILGEFFRSSGVALLSPGLYLSCNIAGSRKNQEKFYALVIVRPDATMKEVSRITGTSGYDRYRSGHDWALKLWPAIEAGLEEVKRFGETVK